MTALAASATATVPGRTSVASHRRSGGLTWVAWRPLRTYVIVGVAWTALLAVFCIVVGLDYRNASTGLTTGCHDLLATTHCLSLGNELAWAIRLERVARVLLTVTPAFLGVALGVRIGASDLASGAARMAWTQSRSRTSVVSANLLLAAIAVVACTAALALCGQWFTPIVTSGESRLMPFSFDAGGVVPVAYGLGALAIGALCGTIKRRPGWSIPASLIVFAGPRLLLQWKRFALVSPSVHVGGTIFPQWATAGSSHAFAIASTYVIPSGGVFLQQGYVPLGSTTLSGYNWVLGDRVRSCVDNPVTGQGTGRTEAQCAASLHAHLITIFQPASNYWPIQGLETGIFVLLAAVVIGLTLLLHRRQDV
ncbi:MAG TPA: hypothetical protein VGS21_02815 [Acidimicrobiales bacterium]|nr:hypothetical protein [Acidimicrobiales bacterium]